MRRRRDGEEGSPAPYVSPYDAAGAHKRAAAACVKVAEIMEYAGLSSMAADYRARAEQHKLEASGGSAW